MWAELGLTGTLWPLILPNLVGDAFSIFLLRQFLLTIPQEYSDAARVDGASELRIMLRVIVPMAKPAIAATAMFMFFFTWNDYFGPLLYTSENPSNWTVALGLASFRGAAPRAVEPRDGGHDAGDAARSSSCSSSRKRPSSKASH